MKFSGCCQRFEKAQNSRALVFWISHRVSQGSAPMTSCKPEPQLHALKWEACWKRQEGGDPLYLRVPGLIDIYNKNKKRETKIAMSSDLTVSCHVETERTTCIE